MNFVTKDSKELASSIFIVSVIGERNQVYVGMRSIEPTGRSEEVMPIPDQWNYEQKNLTQGPFRATN